jgi:hypothetical protein
MSLEPVLARIAQIESAVADPASLLASGGSRVSATAPAASSTPANASTSPVASAASASPSFASLLSGASSTAGATTTTLAQADALNAVYGMDALASLSGGQGSAGGTTTVDPTAELMSLLGIGSSGSSGASASTSPLGAVGAGSIANGPGNQAIVQIAESQVGQTEQPPGSNDGPAISMYRTAVAGADPGEPWCAQFASWVARQAGAPIGPGGEGLSAVSQIWSWAQQTGRAIPNGPGVVPAPGDLIVFGDEHVGIVTGVQSDGDIDTVEGNYDNQVAANVRGPDEATGYVNMGG